MNLKASEFRSTVRSVTFLHSISHRSNNDRRELTTPTATTKKLKKKYKNQSNATNLIGWCPTRLPSFNEKKKKARDEKNMTKNKNKVPRNEIKKKNSCMRTIDIRVPLPTAILAVDTHHATKKLRTLNCQTFLCFVLMKWHVNWLISWRKIESAPNLNQNSLCIFLLQTKD